LIPSVPMAARLCGQGLFYYSQGTRVGMIPLVNAKVITEIQAFEILFGLEAHHVGGGGVGGSEGSVVIVAEGEKGALDRAIRLIESIKGEPPLRPKKSLCINCLPTTPSKLAKPEEQFPGLVANHCMFRWRREEELPGLYAAKGCEGLKGRPMPGNGHLVYFGGEMGTSPGTLSPGTIRAFDGASNPQISLLHIGVLKQFIAPPRQHYLAVLEDVSPIAKPQ